MSLPRLLALLLLGGLVCASLAGAQDGDPVPGQPSAAITVSPQRAFVGQVVVLDGSASSDPEGGTLHHAWDVNGDGSADAYTGIDSRLATAFFTPGVNRVGLRVIDPTNLQRRDDVTAFALIFPGGSFPVDRAPPTVRLSRISRSLRRALRRGVVVRLRCSEACTMAASVGVDRRTGRRFGLRGRGRTMGRDNRVVIRAGSRRLVLKLSRTARRKLRSAATVRVTLRFQVVDPVGNWRKVQRTIFLRR